MGESGALVLTELRVEKHVERRIAPRRALFEGTCLAACQAELYRSFGLLELSMCNLLKPSLPVALLCQLSSASLRVIRTIHHGRGASSASRSAHAFYLYS